MAATEKFAVGAQSAGFVSLEEAITDLSDYTTGTIHKVKIPAGMINIGGSGRGYVIEENLSYVFTPPLSVGSWVIYASPSSTPTGIAQINHDTYSNYIGGGGDNTNRRAFCYLRVIGTSPSVIQPSSIKSYNNYDYDNIYSQLNKMGFYFNKLDFNFKYRGQYFDEEVTFDVGVTTGDVVYKSDSDSKYYKAISDDTVAERVIGVADVGRETDGRDANIHEGNFVVSSGFLDVGTTILPDADFPIGTYVYLSSLTAGLMVRDFDKWISNNTYSLGERIAVITDAGTGTGHVAEVTIAGQSDVPEPTWTVLGGAGWVDVDSSSDISVGDTMSDGGVTWTIVAVHDPVFIPEANAEETNRKIRIGITLGSGVLLLQPGAALIDDHDESAHAHKDIQDALNKAGIYVQNTDKGKTTFSYRGQMFDEKADFSGLISGEKLLVYRNTAGTYQKALADESVAENVLGMSYSVEEGDYAVNEGIVLSGGFIGYDTSAYADGDEIYLHASIAGTFSTTDSGVRIGTVIVAATEANGGLILLHLGAANELDDHNEHSDSHDNFQLALKKAGVYVAGSPYPHGFVGQGFDEISLFGTVANGDAVYVSGNDGTNITYSRAIADGSAASKYMGVVIDSSNGLVASQGFVDVGVVKLPNGTFPEGTDVYVSASVAGDYTVTPTEVKAGLSLGEGILLVSTIGTTSNKGDVTFEDVTYQVLFENLHFSEVYYDIFDEIGSVDTVGGTAAYDGVTRAYDGVSGDYIEHTYNLPAAFSRFLIHYEADITADIQISVDSVSVTKDDDFYTASPDSSLVIRFTWGSGPGELTSYGLFWDYEEPAFSLARLFEKDVLAGAEAAGNDLTIPNSARYLLNGKSLQVYRNGLRQEITEDYLEVDERTIKVQTSGGWAMSDRLIYVEDYTNIDVSEDNTTKLNLEHNATGEHVFIDKVTGKSFRIEVHDGVIQTVPI